MREAKSEIIQLLNAAAGAAVFDLAEVIVPPDSQLGDLGVAVFTLAKQQKENPVALAQKLATAIQKQLPAGWLKNCQAVGPYVNFFVAENILAKVTLKAIQRQGLKYGWQESPVRQRMMFEYSGPNTHKAFHVGHLRNTLLGAALVRLSRSQGNLVLAANYINDVGSHVAKVLWYLQKNPAASQQPMGEIYAQANRLLTEQPEKESEVAVMMQSLEEVLPPRLPKTSAQRQLKKLWEQTRQQSLKEFKSWYEMLGVKFQVYFFEKDLKLRSKEMVEDLLAKGLAKKSEGAVIVDLAEENLGVLLILRSNGTALYATSDLVLAQEKFRRFKIDRSVYLTDSRQSFYFQQLFTVLKKWGFSEELTHVPYEFVTVNGKVLASRAGQTMTLAEVWQRAVDLALGQTKQRHSAWSEKKIKRTAEGLALAVLDFEMLKTSPRNKIDFDLEKALSFEGFTGPYLLYTIARINSIFAKAKARFLGLAQVELLQAPSEIALLKTLASYPEILQQANQEMNPAIVAQYLFNLAKQFATFYEQESVLTAPAPLRKARLYLLSGVRQVMHNGLEILGIKALSEM